MRLNRVNSELSTRKRFLHCVVNLKKTIGFEQLSDILQDSIEIKQTNKIKQNEN